MSGVDGQICGIGWHTLPGHAAAPETRAGYGRSRLIVEADVLTLCSRSRSLHRVSEGDAGPHGRSRRPATATAARYGVGRPASSQRTTQVARVLVNSALALVHSCHGIAPLNPPIARNCWIAS